MLQLAALSKLRLHMPQRLIPLAIALCCCIAGAGIAFVLQRDAACSGFPAFAENQLPQPIFVGENLAVPQGWSARARGVELRMPAVDSEGFDLDGDGRALKLVGIANAAVMPVVEVHEGERYCASVRALSDGVSGPRARLVFAWQDSSGTTLASGAGDWQPVTHWRPNVAGLQWSTITAAFAAPRGAVALRVAVEPTSDDRIYLDMPAVRPVFLAQPTPPPPVSMLRPWPAGARAAFSFSFDWETAMGGLIHSRSADDPLADVNPTLRAMRMREGITTTIELFEPYGILATYYANGYNFLLGNTERRTFMGDPRFAWARTDPPFSWKSDIWTRERWFSPDPYGTVASHPAWYAGDLLVPLRAAGHDVQSHTFSHFYGGFASTGEWEADLAEWNRVAAERGVAPATSLAFPWSGSAGMNEDAWRAIEEAGIISLTRTARNPNQAQYQLVTVTDPQCRSVPGHEALLACPDFYLTERTAMLAPAQIQRTIEVGGALDLWAHTEEVVSPTQIAAWRGVVAYATDLRDAGEVWIAPLAQIAARQQAVERVQVRVTDREGATVYTLVNGATALVDLTLRPGFVPGRVSAGARIVRGMVVFDLAADETREVTVWPA